MAISLSVFIVVAQLGAICAIGVVARQEIFSPSMPWMLHALIDEAQICQGELVCPLWGFPSTGMRFLRFADLKTGQIRKTETMQEPLYRNSLISDGKRLWGIGATSVYESDRTTSITHYPKRLIEPATDKIFFYVFSFIYEGNLAFINRDSNDVDQLFVLVEGEWKVIGQLAGPEAYSALPIHERKSRSVLAGILVSNRPASEFIRVLNVNGQYHLFQTVELTQISYRTGFDFVATQSVDDPVSALAPANVTGWSPLEYKQAARLGTLEYIEATRLGSTATIGDQLFSAHHNEIVRIILPNETSKAFQFESLVQFKDLWQFNDKRQKALVSEPGSNAAYLLVRSQAGDIDVYPFDGKQLQPRVCRIDGAGADLLRWMMGILLQLVAVVVIGTILLIWGADWLTKRAEQSTYSLGHQTVSLARLGRRSLARLFDLALILAPLAIHAVWLISHASTESIVMSLGSILFPDQYQGLRDEIVRFLPNLAPLVPAAASALIVASAFAFSAGNWGVTPGKWLCCIRVVRTNLRSCGVARSLLRELLLWLDTPLLLTAIPGVMCQLVTQNRQRIGDLLADTIVIDAAATSRTETDL